jgi:cytochrome c biogenesis protein CcdA
VLKLSDGNGLSLNAVPGAVPAAGAPLEQEAEQPAFDASAVLAALLGALVGGLLLNIMPCVFPILSLKALSLAKAGGDERAAKREALAYTAGAVLICLALGAALLALRAGGAAAGWAFQLQDPRVILILLLLTTAIALNLAGLFELPASPAATGSRQGRHGRCVLDRRACRLCGDALAPAPSWARRLVQRWCFPPPSRWPSSPAWDWVWHCRSCCSASCLPSAAVCPSPARGWRASAG